MWPNPQENAALVTFTGKILNRKLHFLCSELALKTFRFLVSFQGYTLCQSYIIELEPRPPLKKCFSGQILIKLNARVTRLRSHDQIYNAISVT